MSSAAPEFLLFPTVAHSHAERVRPQHRDLLAAAASDSTENPVVVRAGAKIVAAVEVNRQRMAAPVYDDAVLAEAAARVRRSVA